MADLKDILGNETVKEHFRAAVLQEKVSHAYILEGEKGSGKKMLASAFAKILQCEHRGRAAGMQHTGEEEFEACGTCTSCIQMENGSQPDVIWVRHEKPAVISVSEIREQVVNTMDVMPYRGPYKIYIIDEAEKMNAAAQNAILKTIEEPPAYGVILLLTSNRGAFLSTILSRCVLLTVRPVPDETIRGYLTEKLHVEKETADFCAGFSMGNLGKAIHAALSEEFLELRQCMLSVLQYIHEAEPFELAAKVKEMKRWKDSCDDLLDIMLMWFRDVLYIKKMKTTDAQKRLIFQEKYAALQKQSAAASFEDLNDIFEEIGHTRRRVRANVNYEASMESLCMEIRSRLGTERV